MNGGVSLINNSGILSGFRYGMYSAFDNARLKPFSHSDKFWLEGYPSFLIGRGIVLGTSKEGEAKKPLINLEKLKELIFFHHPSAFEAQRI